MRNTSPNETVLEQEEPIRAVTSFVKPQDDLNRRAENDMRYL